jgi:hypothetical protein
MSGAAMVGAAGSSGLVLSSTTQTRDKLRANGEAVERMKRGGRVVDRLASRLRRMSHGVKTAARLMSEVCTRRGFRYRAAMITLTYRDAAQWRACHVREFLDTVRKFTQRAGHDFRYVWVAEMQQRGVVHYHVLVWMPHGFRLPKPDDRGWWAHGSTKIEWARKCVGYLAKYASKGMEPDAPAFPKGIRISGNGGLDLEAKREFRWWRAPSEAREFLGPGADVRRINGGRFDAVTGLFWASPWTLVLLDGQPFMINKDLRPCSVSK